MIICGLQKTTLLDFPEKTACTVFTGGCNFSCPFCHNASLVVDNIFEEVILEDEFFNFLKKRKGILDGVCVTGGEPLIQKDIDNFMQKIKNEGYLVKLDTNGSFPQKLKSLVKNGLVDYVAMDIKNSPKNYGIAAGIPYIDIEKINESIEFLMENNIDFEFRTTAVKGIHTLNDFYEIGKWIKGEEKYFVQNFIDSGDTISSRNNEKCTFSGFSQEEMNDFVKIVRHYVPNAEIRGM